MFFSNMLNFSIYSITVVVKFLFNNFIMFKALSGKLIMLRQSAIRYRLSFILDDRHFLVAAVYIGGQALFFVKYILK